jgi:hypothetical protein
MSKRNKQNKSGLQQQHSKSPPSDGAIAPRREMIPDPLLAEIDELNQGGLYIRALDLVCKNLEDLNATSQAISDYEKRLVTAIRGLCYVDGLADDGSALRDCLVNVPRSVIQVVGATWARACTACSSFPKLSETERGVADAVSDALSSVYQRLGVLPNAQNYEKRKAITTALPQLEAELRELINSPIEVGIAGTIRQRFMKMFKGPLTQAVVWPFLPEDMRSELRFAQLFTAILELGEAGPDELLDAFEDASAIVRSFTDEANRYSTTYSVNILGELGRKLQLAIDEYMGSTPLAQPAHFVVTQARKKYPLLSSGTTLRATFQLQNSGPGTAREVVFRISEFATTSLAAEKTEWYLGSIGTSTIEVTIPIAVLAPTQDTLIEVEISWKNFDHSERIEKFTFELNQQRTDVDWETCRYLDPYSLEPVEEEAELVGRTEVLEQLTSLAFSKSVGSCYLYGQKRVGKTSVVKTLDNILKLSDNPKRPMVIYLERGEFGAAEPIVTVTNLGRVLCQRIKNSDNRLGHLEIPSFNEGLAPMMGFLDDVLRIAPLFRALIVLDEFDELPLALYKRTEVGDAFFGSLRSFTNKPSFGLILVGSENMRHVIHLQGHALNKFQTMELDYFDRHRHWTDFGELVRRPVQAVLDIEDDAIVSLYAGTSGNPFFSKLICGRLFKMMVSRRDCHVTKVEMEEAIKIAVRQDVGINKVQHFWSDGIFEAEAKHEEISLRRRKILLSLAYAARKQIPIKKELVLTVCREKFGLDEIVVEHELSELTTPRKIVRVVEGSIDFVVPFFLRWLTDNGIDEIIAVSIDADASLRHSREEEKARIQPEEIMAITSAWQGGYKGRQISEDLVRTWLNQFGDNTRQRLAFAILRGLKFYCQSEIRAKVKEAYGIVRRQLTHVPEEGKRKRSDILVSYLDGPGKSGARYAKLYADENDIYYDNVVAPESLGDRLKKAGTEVKAVVFVDDLIGTGKSAAGNFEKFAEEQNVVAYRDQVKMFFLAICGLSSGVQYFEKRLSKLPLQVHVHVCDRLDEKDQVFSESSRFFQDAAQRHEGLALCREIGTTLEKKQPLGYDEAQLAVIFEDTAPNNSLPVLWKKGKNWTPLFPRD